MTAAGFAALTSALCLNPSHLRELELSENKLGGSGVKELCDVLKNQQIRLSKLGFKIIINYNYNNYYKN